MKRSTLREQMDDPEAAIIANRGQLMLPLAWRKVLQGLRDKSLSALTVRCAEIALDHLDPAPRWSTEPHGPVTLTVVLVNSERAGLAAETNGGALRVVSSEGDGAGDSLPRRPRGRQDVGGPLGDDHARD